MDNTERYTKATHAMQSGVAMKMNHFPEETDPKHLRVGVNSAMVETSALVKLLIDKGIITPTEWFKYLADGMEHEAKMYEAELEKRLGTKVTLA